VSVDVQNLLLQSLASGRAPSLSPADVLGQLDEDDPSRALLATLLLQRQTAESEVEQPEEERWPEEGAGEIPPSERRLLRKLEHVREEVRCLEERNDAFAAAVGACYLCWGNDPACDVCGGSGRPGFFAPDAALFGDLVAPALQHLRRRPREPEGRHVGPSAEPATDDDASTEGGVQ
jgi:hypothetical protein